MRISGTEPSSVILSQTMKFKKYFQIADPYPLLIVKTHFLISQNAT